MRLPHAVNLTTTAAVEGALWPGDAGLRADLLT